jgi:tRNA threonylcarbamoyladenosine modification (KEOPS) complex  Pcc1 subunit
LKSDTRSESTNTENKFVVRDSKLLIQISTTNIADLRACVNTNLRLTNMAYLSILD